jgi:hypothetical protein
MRCIKEEGMVENADKMGQLFRAELNKIQVVTCLSLLSFVLVKNLLRFDLIRPNIAFSTDTFAH